ncbi:sensor histidine kinase [Camelliibacillus cellulosilyticus]|uniref:Sensor histidine kinase n=1 Tax=Camelliibacillus cellulosilyticus TaxID=2174486 RepID=A0ABV9GM75_9BACL
MSLRFKLVIGFVAFIILPLFLLGVGAFFVSEHMIEKKYSQLNEVTLKSVARNIDTIMNEVNQLSVSAIANPTVQQILSLDTAHMSDTELKLHTIDAEQALQKILYAYPFVYSVMLYDENGVSYKVGIYDSEAIPYKKLVAERFYKQAVKENGRPVWVGPYQYPDITGQGTVLTEIRKVKDIDTLRNIGTLVLQTNLDGIAENIKEFAPNDQFLLVNRDGLIFYDNHHHFQGNRLAGVMDKTLPLPSSYQTFKRAFNGRESLVSVYGLSLDNWRILSIRSWHSLSKEVETIVIWITVITAICLIGALLFNILFVNRTAESIINVVHLMKQVEEGNLYAAAKVEGSGEMKSLVVGFNSLVTRVRGLLEEVKEEQERKKKAEMMLLEAQIRPHFLFNTLESINALAIQNEGRKVSRMIHQLGQILRISMERHEEIPIQKEVDHLKSYLAIQKYRFENLFDYDVTMPETIKDHAILKLTLQPLVENAIHHAFHDLNKKGKIEVVLSDAGDTIHIFIRDNGSGIEPSVLARFQSAKPGLKPKEGGLGLKNVADRLRIRYGEKYGLMICSEPRGGTIIKCVIPKYKSGDQNGTNEGAFNR